MFWILLSFLIAFVLLIVGILITIDNISKYYSNYTIPILCWLFSALFSIACSIQISNYNNCYIASEHFIKNNNIDVVTNQIFRKEDKAQKWLKDYSIHVYNALYIHDNNWVYEESDNSIIIKNKNTSDYYYFRYKKDKIK